MKNVKNITKAQMVDIINQLTKENEDLKTVIKNQRPISYTKPAPDPTKHVGYVKTVNKTNEGMQEQAQERYDQERAKIQHNSTISHKQLWYLSYLMGCRDNQGHNFKFASYPKLDKDTLDRAIQFYQHFDKGFRQLNNEDIQAHIKAAGYPNVPESYTRAIKDINFKDRCEMYTKLCRYYKLDTETGIMTNCIKK